MDDQDTRSRILDAAQELIGIHGVAGTSMRMITKTADVNLSAVNYHFGSKDQLVVDLSSRGIRQLNAGRIQKLEEAEAHYTDTIPLRVLMEAFVLPVFEFAQKEENRAFLKVLCRIHNEPSEFYQIIMEREWQPLADRFFTAFRKSLPPEISDAQLYWRIHFAVGAMIHTLNHSDCIHIISGGICNFDQPEEVMGELLTFLTAGTEQKSESPPQKETKE